MIDQHAVCWTAQYAPSSCACSIRYFDFSIVSSSSNLTCLLSIFFRCTATPPVALSSLPFLDIAATPLSCCRNLSWRSCESMLCCSSAWTFLRSLTRQSAALLLISTKSSSLRRDSSSRATKLDVKPSVVMMEHFWDIIMMSHRVPQAAGRRQARHSRGLFLSSEANGQTIFGAAVLFDKYLRLKKYYLERVRYLPVWEIHRGRVF